MKKQSAVKTNLLRTSFLLLLMISGANASLLAAFQVTGQVMSKKSNEALPYANVVIQGTTAGTSTDMQGKFSFEKIKPGKYTFMVSYSGYSSEQGTFTIDKDTNLIFRLEETSYNINTVVVTGTRTERLLKDVPVLTNVVDRKQIESIGTNSIQDALSFSLPNINFNKSAAGISMQLAGLEAKYTVFLIDGEKISGETNGNIDYNRLRVSDIERIEIVKGASGLLYGSNAIGGVVNIITKKPKQAVEVSLGSRYSNFNEYDADAILGFNKKNFSAKTSMYLNGIDGYDLTPSTPYEKTQEAFQSKSVNQQLEYKINDKIKLELNGKYYERERFDSDLIPLHSKDYDKTLSFKSGWMLDDKNSLALVLNYDQYSTKQVEELFDDRETDSYINTMRTGRLSGNFELPYKNNLNVGMELIGDELLSNRIDGNTKSQSDIVAYGQDEMKICSFFTAIGGLRMNVHSSYGFHLVPQLSGMLNFSDLKIRGGYSMGYRSPSIKEMYMNFSPVPVIEIHGNENLMPESSQYYSLSAEYSKSVINTSVTVYHNSVENMITEVQDLVDPKIWTYQNIKSVQVQGLDFIMRARIGYGFSVNASYTYTDSEDKTSGSQMLGTAKNNAAGMLNYELNKDAYRLGINLKANYSGAIPYEEMDEATGEVTAKLYAPHTIWNLTTTHHLLGGITITLGVNNLFNVYQLENVMNLNPGRRFFAGLRINIHQLKLNH